MYKNLMSFIENSIIFYLKWISSFMNIKIVNKINKYADWEII